MADAHSAHTVWRANQGMAGSRLEHTVWQANRATLGVMCFSGINYLIENASCQEWGTKNHSPRKFSIKPEQPQVWHGLLVKPWDG
jgi:hypothetical protein